MTPTVTLTIGISGSGKTTWAKEQCRLNPNTIRINRDDIRASMFGMTLQQYFDGFTDNIDNGNEKLITDLIWAMSNRAVAEGKNVILDNTHLNIKYIKEATKKISGDCQFNVEWFLIDPETAIERDQARETVVGESVIRKQFQNFTSLYEKKDQVAQVLIDRLKLNFAPVEQNENLPKAFCVDLDGTLALMKESGRLPYDWARVGEDLINEGVAGVVKALANEEFKIIICTGRDGSCEKETKQWLSYHGISYDNFYIRKAGDCRKDSIVKREFLEDIIKKYYVCGVFDDRKQVKRMWVQSGIFVFDVNQFDEEF